MHVLITGGCGFIGSYIAEHHLKKGDQVHIVDDLSLGKLENIAHLRHHALLHFDNADIIIWPDLIKSVAEADRIYHMAAMTGIHHLRASSVKAISTNIAGTERVLRAVKATGGGQRILVASSSEVYGLSVKPTLSEKDQLLIESASNAPWDYAISKLADEALGMVYNHAINTPTTMIRFFSAIGPRHTSVYSAVVPKFIKQACNNEPMTIYGDGNQARCYCDVRDIVIGLDLIADNDKSIGEIVNVGNDKEISTNDLAKLIRRLAKSTSEIKFVPYGEDYIERSVNVMHRKPDLTKFYELTQYQHQWTLEQTLEEMIKRHKSNPSAII